jgi:hypothetical protein
VISDRSKIREILPELLVDHGHPTLWILSVIEVALMEDGIDIFLSG